MNKKIVEQRAQIFDHLFDAVIFTDGKGIITDWNRSAEHMLGYLREEIGGESILKIFSTDDGGRIFTEIVEALTQKESWGGDIELFPRHGVARHARTVVVPLPGSKQPHAGMVWVCHDISEQLLLEKRMKTLEHYDSLTGIPNWGVLYDRIEQLIVSSRRNQLMFALLFIDLNNFRQINESAGYPAGDSILRDVAQRLQSVLRQSDTVARLGSDEFVVLAAEIRTQDDADLVADNIRAALRGAFIVGSSSFHISGSIGITIYPNDGDTADELLIKSSDRAFAQKQSRK